MLFAHVLLGRYIISAVPGTSIWEVVAWHKLWRLSANNAIQIVSLLLPAHLPHIIKRIDIIEGVVTDGILRHLLASAACAVVVEELLSLG